LAIPCGRKWSTSRATAEYNIVLTSGECPEATKTVKILILVYDQLFRRYCADDDACNTESGIPAWQNDSALCIAEGVAVNTLSLSNFWSSTNNHYLHPSWDGGYEYTPIRRYYTWGDSGDEELTRRVYPWMADSDAKNPHLNPGSSKYGIGTSLDGQCVELDDPTDVDCADSTSPWDQQVPKLGPSGGHSKGQFAGGLKLTDKWISEGTFASGAPSNIGSGQYKFAGGASKTASPLGAYLGKAMAEISAAGDWNQSWALYYLLMNSSGLIATYDTADWKWAEVASFTDSKGNIHAGDNILQEIGYLAQTTDDNIGAIYTYYTTLITQAQSDGEQIDPTWLTAINKIQPLGSKNLPGALMPNEQLYNYPESAQTPASQPTGGSGTKGIHSYNQSLSPGASIGDLWNENSLTLWENGLDISQWIGFIIHSLQKLVHQKMVEIHGVENDNGIKVITGPMHREDAVGYCTVLADIVHYMGIKGVLPYRFGVVFDRETTSMPGDRKWHEALGIENWSKENVREWFVRMLWNGTCDDGTPKNPAFPSETQKTVVPKAVFGEDYNEWTAENESTFIQNISNGTYFNGTAAASAIAAGLTTQGYWNSFDWSPVLDYDPTLVFTTFDFD
jgi:hypothetical protein